MNPKLYKSTFGRWAIITSLCLAIISLFIVWPFYNAKPNKLMIVRDDASINRNEEDEEYEENEKEDGILLAQEHEFEVTKDISLGYIPKYRLIRADEDLKTARLSGNANSRIDALTWTERGPNSDVTGVSNGNTRGSQPATDAVTSGRMRAI